jgi:hypothetical protein
MIFRFTCFMFLLVTRGRPLYLFESLVFFYSERRLRINSPRQITEYMVDSILARRFRIFLFLQGLLRNFKFSKFVNFWGSFIKSYIGFFFSSFSATLFIILICQQNLININLLQANYKLSECKKPRALQRKV